MDKQRIRAVGLGAAGSGALFVAISFYIAIDMGGPIAFVVGAKHSGRSDGWLQETPIRIPTAGQVDSLNVAQTATVLMFEAIRQRATTNPRLTL